MDRITLFHNQSAFIASKLVADRFGKRHGDRLSTEEFWDILGAQALFMIELLSAEPS